MSTIKIVKKLFLLFTIILAVSCENIIDAPPAPVYRPEVVDTSNTFVSAFDNGLGKFTVKSISGDSKWAASKYNYVMINGRVETGNELNEDWLISPSIQLPSNATSVFSFDFAAREFTNISTEFTIWVSEDFKPELEGVNGAWTQVSPIDPFKNTVDR
jgi:hypothetical protein